MSYNLLLEKWIPVMRRQGHVDRVGILEALTQACNIRQIAASNPMDRAAILRFLLAFLYWCHPEGSPILPESFPKEWFIKLDENKDCFNLLGEGKRFYQYKSSSRNDKKLSVNYLVHEIPTGTNVRHFRHSLDEVDGLCRACCAMGLLRLPVFTTQGGKGKSPGINARPPVYAIPLGASLAETLRLSWRPVSNLGTPAWEEPDMPLPKAGDVPLLTGLTWLPRRVWLDDPEEPEANCISCGRKEPLIRRCIFAGIGSTKSTAGGRVWRDPHVIRESKDKAISPSDALYAYDAAAGDWANVAIGILKGEPDTEKRKVWIVGFASKQNKYVEAKEYEIPLLLATNHDKVQNVVAGIQTWQREGSRLAAKIKKALPRTEKIGQVIARDLRSHVESRASAKLGKLLAGGEDLWEQAGREYRPIMAALAQSLSPGYTTTALQKRRQIAVIKPYIQLKIKECGKSGPNERGQE
ncbi:MAG: type I-E CRISPR-associated protein Cse1/CasA [candidate division WOR-3 bacterium]